MATKKTDSLTSRNGALWIQPDGPNTPLVFLGCHQLGDIEDSQGSIDLIRKMDRSGKGWKTVGQKKSPPDKISTSIETLTFQTLDWLEKISDNFTIYAMQRAGGRPDVFSNYIRSIILPVANLSKRKYAGLVSREEEKEATIGVDIEAWPPVIVATKGVARRKAVIETSDLLDVAFYGDDQKTMEDYGVVVGSAGAYAANIGITKDGGDTFTWKTGPFTSMNDITSVVVFPIGYEEYRILVAMKSPTTDQGKIAYSDDDGSTWITVNIGGATAGHGAASPTALYAFDWTNIYLATKGGAIYKSDNGGASWSLKTSSITAQELNAIYFQDENDGMSVGKAGAVLYTSDAGDSWELRATPASEDLVAITKSESGYWWCSSAEGRLFYSSDDGETWLERAFSGQGTGEVVDVKFANEVIGYMIHNNESGVGKVLRTINGGTTWEEIDTPTNLGLNSIGIAGINMAYAVGDIQGGTSIVVKVSRE